jgi:DNA-binding beta-propeller fold protein YncE
VLCGVIVLQSQKQPPSLRTDTKVGPVEDGGFLLPSAWTLRPAGLQVPLQTLPLAAVLTEDKKSVLILQSGYNTPVLSLHALPSGAKLSSVELKDSFHGLLLYKSNVYVGGGSTGAVHQIRLQGTNLQFVRSHVVEPNPPAKEGSFIGDVVLARDGEHLYAADITQNVIFTLHLESGKVVARTPTARMPSRLLLHPSRDELLVSSWIDAEVVRQSTATGNVIQRVAVGTHPTDMLWEPKTSRLFVAAAHTNDVYVLNGGESGELTVKERLHVALTPRQPVGMTPSGLAYDNAQKRLYIACSDANTVAVADVSGKLSMIDGFVPVGWYPTAVMVLPDQSLLVLNGKGVQSLPNPRGPTNSMDRRTLTPQQRREVQDISRILVGGMSLIPAPNQQNLEEYTRTVYRNSPYRDQLLDNAAIPPGGPIPSKIGQSSPIKHVIYIVKENRTYDQVFGDMERGNGDASLVLFDEKSSINHRRLAREYGLLDNFYVNGDVSADGHNWSAGAISPDVTNKIHPNMYAGRGVRMSLYWGRPPQNFTEEAARPHGGYLWTRAFEAGISVRNYGWMTKHAAEAKTGERQIVDAESKQLMNATSPFFRGFDVTYPDTDRLQFFLQDLAAFEQKGEMPRLTVMRLGNDHTAGMRAGAFSPRAMFADNDIALGKLVEAVSKSRFWKDTAIFVVEDDAQAGPDHIDAHRSIALVISPYAKRHYLDSNMYNTVSVLRTIELILGLKPMTQFDAAARPMHTVFTSTPDFTPYAAVEPLQSRLERNPPANSLAARSARLDLGEADMIDDHEMNDILYLALQGRPAPAPRRSYFYPGVTQGDD